MKRLVIGCIVAVLLQCGFLYAQWETQAAGAAGALTLPSFADSNYGWLYYKGIYNLLKTTNGGSSWQYRYISGYILVKIKFVTQNTGYSIANSRENTAQWWILKTTDGGQNWSQLKQILGYTGMSEDKCNLFVLGNDLIWCSSQITLYSSFDGGTTWQNSSLAQKIDASKTLINNIFFINQLTGWVVFSNSVYYTKDGGTTWSDGNLSSADEVYFNDADNGFAVSGKEIYGTVDGGQTWSKLYTFSQSVSKLKFVNSATGYVFNTAALYKTTDAGVSWSSIKWDNLYLGSSAVTDYYCSDENNIWLTGTSGLIAKSSSGKSINIIKPEGGVSVYTNYKTTIAWSHSNLQGCYAKLEYSTDAGANWNFAKDSISLSALSYEWQTKGIPVSSACMIRLTEYNESINAVSESFKVIKDSREINITYPDISSCVIGGDTVKVIYSSNYTTGYIEGTLYLYTDTTKEYSEYHSVYSGSVEIPDFYGYGKIYLWETNSPQINAETGFFKVRYTPVITSSMLNAKMVVKNDTTYTISFTSKGNTSLDIKFSTDSGNSWADITGSLTIEPMTEKEYSFQLQTPSALSFSNMLRFTSPEKTYDYQVIVNDKDKMGVFPLKIGNKWFYKNYTLYYGDYDGKADTSGISTIIAAADTVLMNDGKYYYKLDYYLSRNINSDTSTFQPSSSKYIRQEKNKVYEYVEGGSIKELCDFSTTLYWWKVLDRNIRQYYYTLSGFLNYNCYDYRISDSLGITIQNHIAGTKYGETYTYLTGCILDGKVYGTVRSNYVVSVDENPVNQLPTEYSLYQNYPNPFNPSTKIKYSIPESGRVIIKVFDMLGREIETLVNEEKSAGSYEAVFNAKNLASGTYIYRIFAGKFSRSKKFVLVK